MNQKQKIAHIVKTLSKWKDQLHIDPKTIIDVEIVKTPYNPSDFCDKESTRREETVVVAIQIAIMGLDTYLDAYRASPDGILASIDTGRGEYGTYYLQIYENVMGLDRDRFKQVVDSIILHECLHVVMFPLCSYAAWLESEALGGR